MVDAGTASIFCDIGLPELNGYQVARELKQDPAMAKACMIAITGYGSDEDRQRSRAAAGAIELI
jgi:CheY-like chemotaxis protein